MTSDPFFHMTINDVFFIKGRGVVVIGTVDGGTLKVGDEIHLVRPDGSPRTVKVTGIEKFRKMLNEANAGDDVGILLRGVDKKDVQKGDMLLGG